MNSLIVKVEKKQMNSNTHLSFKTGYTVCVNFKIIDNKYKNKIQNFEGLVISINKNGLNTTFIVRKISQGEGIEKTFFLYSPTINWIKIKKYGFVRKSKIYYIRKLKGRAARIKEKLKKRRGARVA